MSIIKNSDDQNPCDTMRKGCLPMLDELENVTEHLVRNNIKPTFQRIKIFNCLKNSNHPTIDEIYQAVVLEIPTLSKTTVYNTLNLFIKANIVRCIYIEENETRYDPTVLCHGHFKCEQCEKIFDFSIDIDRFACDELKAFRIQSKDVYFRGICPECQ